MTHARSKLPEYPVQATAIWLQSIRKCTSSSLSAKLLIIQMASSGCRKALRHDLATAVCRVVYELTAVVAHVVDAAEEGPTGTAPEGHLVAHVKVTPFE